MTVAPLLKKNAFLNNGHPASRPPYQAEIQFMDRYSLPLMAEGHNDIIDAEQPETYLMYGTYEQISRDPWKVTYNYWGTTDDREIAARLYPEGDYTFDPFDTEPNTPEGAEAIHAAGEAFQAARTLETDGNLTAAQTAYEDLITTYPTSPEALASLDRIVILASKTYRPLTDLQSYLHSLITTHPTAAVRTGAAQYLGQLAASTGEYPTALAIYDTLYTTATTTADSVYALIDQGYVIQQAATDSGSGLGKTASTLAQDTEFHPQTTQEFVAGKNQLLDVVNGEQSLLAVLRQLDAPTAPAVPPAFTLWQNYPNPFNPTTTIRYRVPKSGWVQLIVYDLTGQRIATLVNTHQAPDTYSMKWDGRTSIGSRVGSGIYFYRLVQGDHTATGKMVLIR